MASTRVVRAVVLLAVTAILVSGCRYQRTWTVQCTTSPFVPHGPYMAQILVDAEIPLEVVPGEAFDVVVDEFYVMVDGASSLGGTFTVSGAVSPAGSVDVFRAVTRTFTATGQPGDVIDIFMGTGYARQGTFPNLLAFTCPVNQHLATVEIVAPEAPSPT